MLEYPMFSGSGGAISTWYPHVLGDDPTWYCTSARRGHNKDSLFQMAPLRKIGKDKNHYQSELNCTLEIFQTSIGIRCIDAYSINTASNRYQWFSFTGTSSNADDYSYGSVSNVEWCSKFGSYTEAAMRNPSHHAVKIPLIMGKSLNWCSQVAHHGCLIAVLAVGRRVVALGRRPGDHVSLFCDRNWMLTKQFMGIKWE